MSRVQSLDGLRGLAALWVLIGHCMILTGFSIPVLGNPDLGVDLFIMLSGFLMVFQYNLRKEREDWALPSIWIVFWIRRFFRLSPLYFVLLVIALAIGDRIYADRVLIDTFLGRSLQPEIRYTDASLTNLVVHMTYIFGLIPSYAFRTPLPDWSIGLEMQFYAVFPILMLLFRRMGWIMGAILVATGSVLIALVMGSLGVFYPMPSFLPLKLHVFLAGMLIAAADPKRLRFYLVLVILLIAIPIGGKHNLSHLAVRELMAVCFFALLHWRGFWVIDQVAKGLSSAPLYWLGELSYGVYLVHLLFLHPVAAWTIAQWGADLPDGMRFVITFGVVAALSYATAYLTLLTVERPGQTLGKRVITVIAARRQP